MTAKAVETVITAVPSIYKFVDSIVSDWLVKWKKSKGYQSLPRLRAVVAQAESAEELLQVFENTAPGTRHNAALRARLLDYTNALNRLDSVYTQATSYYAEGRLTGNKDLEKEAYQLGEVLVTAVSAANDARARLEAQVRSSPGTDSSDAVRGLLTRHPSGDLQGVREDLREAVIDATLATAASRGSEPVLQQVQQTQSAVAQSHTQPGVSAQDTQRQGVVEVNTQQHLPERQAATASPVPSGQGRSNTPVLSGTDSQKEFGRSAVQVQAGTEGEVLPTRQQPQQAPVTPVSTAAPTLEERVRSGVNTYQQLPGTLRSTIRQTVSNLARDTYNYLTGSDMADNNVDAGEGTSSQRAPVTEVPVANERVQTTTKRAAEDQVDNVAAVAGKMSASTTGNTTVQAPALPPNVMLAPGVEHIGPFPDGAAMQLVFDITKHMARESPGSFMYADQTDVAAALVANPPTYRFYSANVRADIKAESHSSAYATCGVYTRIRTTALPNAQYKSAYVTATPVVRAIADGLKTTPGIVLDPEYQLGVPVVSSPQDRWFYVNENATRTVGQYSQQVMARVMSEQVNTHRTGDISLVAYRIVAEALWHRSGMDHDSEPRTAGLHYAMQNDPGTGRWAGRHYTHINSGEDQYRQELLARVAYGTPAEYDALRRIDVASVNLTRVMMSTQFGDGSKPYQGNTAGEQTAAFPDGWNTTNTCIIPMRSTDFTQGRVNIQWVMAHLGLTTTSYKLCSALYPVDVNTGAKIQEWKGGYAAQAFGPTAINWDTWKKIEHVLLVNIDGSKNQDLVIFETNTGRQAIQHNADGQSLQVVQHFLDIIFPAISQSETTVDLSSVCMQTLARFDDVYKPTETEVCQVAEMLTKIGMWCNELPKQQDEQGEAGVYKHSGLCNYQVFRGDDLPLNCFPNEERRNALFPVSMNIPRDGETITAYFDALNLYSRNMMRPARPGHDLAFSGWHTHFAPFHPEHECLTYVPTARAGSMYVSEPKQIYKIARAAGVVKAEGVPGSTARTDWMEAVASSARQAADIFGYALDDVLGRASVSVTDCSGYDQETDGNSGINNLMAKLGPKLRAQIEAMIAGENPIFRMDLKQMLTGKFLAVAGVPRFIDPATTNPVMATAEDTYLFFTDWNLLTLPKRVPDHVLALETNGVLRDHVMQMVEDTAVNFSFSGAAIATNQTPEHSDVHQVAMVLPQTFFQGMLKFATPGDTRMLSKIQNTDNVKKAGLLMLTQARAQPTPYVPLESAILHPWSAAARNVKVGGPPGSFEFTVGSCFSDSRTDVRDSTRIMLRVNPWKWEQLAVKTADNLARANAGTNPALPYTHVQIGRYGSMVNFDSGNVGLGDPQRQLDEYPDALN